MKKQSVYNQPIIFFRIAWMENYNGVTSNDIPKGAGSYVTENKNGGEVYNFTNRNGMYYGFVRIQGDKTINLTKLGASKYDTEINGVTVVFFAKNPIDGGQWIVGWYRVILITCVRQSRELFQGLRGLAFLFRIRLCVLIALPFSR